MFLHNSDGLNDVRGMVKEVDLLQIDAFLGDLLEKRS